MRGWAACTGLWGLQGAFSEHRLDGCIVNRASPGCSIERPRPALFGGIVELQAPCECAYPSDEYECAPRV